MAFSEKSAFIFNGIQSIIDTQVSTGMPQGEKIPAVKIIACCLGKSLVIIQNRNVREQVDFF